MMDEIIDPFAYHWIWTLLGSLALVFLLVGWVVAWRLLLRRQPRDAEYERQLAHIERLKALNLTQNPLQGIRREYDAAFAYLEDRARAEELEPREVLLELNWLLRSYATARRGIDMRTMTLSEIAALPETQNLSVLISNIYDQAFSPKITPYQARVEIERIRKTVAKW